MISSFVCAFARALFVSRRHIPPIARQLYARTPIRVLHHIDGADVPLIGFEDQDPLDMSLSVLRGKDVIHTQYLTNMGVKASCTIPVVVDETLWGLFACHHYSAKPLPFATRTTAELFSQLFSLALDRALLRKSGT